jgi:hypothetical protein
MCLPFLSFPSHQFTMLPKSCLIAVLAALIGTSALSIPRPAAQHHDQIPASLLLSNADQSSLAASVFEITDALDAGVVAEIDAHLRDYKGWDLEEKRLISMEGEMGEEYKWVTEMDKVLMRAKGVKFMDM